MEAEIQYLKNLALIQKRGNKDYTLDRNSLKQLVVYSLPAHGFHHVSNRAG